MSESTDPADRQVLDRAGDTRRPAFVSLARRYTRGRLSRGLDGVWVAGLDEARTVMHTRPVLFVSNHVAWWDTLLLVAIHEALGGQGWAIMDADNLRRLPFLGWVGALPLDRSSSERSRQCLDASAALLDRPGRALWFFPQGRQRPAHLRPLDLKPGLRILHDRNPVDIIPVSLDYVFLERSRPAAIIHFGNTLGGQGLSADAVLSAVEEALLVGLSAIDRAAISATDGRRARTHPRDPLPGFRTLVPPLRWGLRRGDPRAD